MAKYFNNVDPDTQTENSAETLDLDNDEKLKMLKNREQNVDFKSIFSNIDNLKTYLDSEINNVQDLKVFIDIIRDQQKMDEIDDQTEEETI